MKGWRRTGLFQWRKGYTTGATGLIDEVGGLFMVTYGARFLGDADDLESAADLADVYHEVKGRHV